MFERLFRSVFWEWGKQYILPILFVCFLAGFVLPILYLYGLLGFYSRFISDDYCVAAVARDLPWYESQIYWYTNWHGAYIVTLFDEFLPSLVPDGLPFIVPLLLLLWALTLWASIYALFPKILVFYIQFLITTVLGLSFLFVFLLLNPQVPQTIFWWSGMRAYNLPILVLFVFILISRWVTIYQPNCFLSLFLGLFISFILAGFGEVFSALFIVFFVFVVLLELYYDKNGLFGKPKGFFLLASATGLFVGTMIILSSPGNQVRQSLFPEPPGLLNVFLFSLLWFSQYLLVLVKDIGQVLGLVGIYFLFFWAGIVSGYRRKPDRLGLLFLLMSFAFLFGVFIPSAYATSQPPPERTVSLGVFFFLLLVVASGFVTGQEQARKKSRLLEFRTMVIVFIAILFLSLSAQLEKQEWAEKKQDYVFFSHTWDNTHELILRAKNSGETSIAIPPLKNLASLDDPTDDPAYWVNRCFSDYYDMQITVRPGFAP
ncbi:MAG: hypothetical protein L6461_22250 [Anaerolineae bacterium]|nr:hypothetical protein [Anaerolineae bacterium]